jgi:glycosyltransferase involved in cell wall biosynthesis
MYAGVYAVTVSAIVSAYYAKDFIRSRLDNLMMQDPRPEVIVVAQTDSTESAVSSTYPVKLIKTPHIPTIYAAWNMAIKEATGDYITNANCDDRTYQGAYALMSRILNDDPEISLVYGDEYVLDEDRPWERKFKIRSEFDSELLKYKCFVGPFPMWRKSLHEKYGYFDESLKVCGDYEFWLRLAKGGERFHHLPQFIGQYYKRAASAEHRDEFLSILENRQVRSMYS